MVDLRIRTTNGISIGNQLVTYISLGFVCASLGVLAFSQTLRPRLCRHTAASPSRGPGFAGH